MTYNCTTDLLRLLLQPERADSLITWSNEPDSPFAVVDRFWSYRHYVERWANVKPVVLIPGAASIDFLLLDLAVQSLQLPLVLVHDTTSAERIRDILDETGAQLLFARERLDLESVAVVVPTEIPDEVGGTGRERLEQAMEKIRPSDLSTIIYTSGTTGDPKGVMLSHGNIMSNVQSITLLLPMDQGHRVISYLPYSHVFERTLIYSYLVLGAKVFFIGSPSNLAAALRDVRPHFFTAVPRILERMHGRVIDHFSARKWLGRKSFTWAIRVADRYRPHRFKPWQWLQIQLIRQLLLRRFRQQMGGELHTIMVGAAHLAPRISKAFQAAGIRVREGYGMTETSPVVTVNRIEPGLNRLGTVGLPLPGVEVRIKEPDESGSGEILVKGPNVMMGYFKKPAETSRVLSDDGWLTTGDVGHLDEKGFLTITDRRKDIFKTSSGKYISPVELESYYRQSDFIEELLIIGFQKPFVTALVIPNFERLSSWAAETNVHWTSPQYMTHNIRVQEKLQAEIDRLNESLPRHKHVREMTLLHRQFSIENGQLSSTMKPIRDKIHGDYAKEIEQMYTR